MWLKQIGPFLDEGVASSSVHFSPYIYIYLTPFLIFSYFIIVDLQRESLLFQELCSHHLATFATVPLLGPSPFKKLFALLGKSPFIFHFFFFLVDRLNFQRGHQLRFFKYLCRLQVNRCLEKRQVSNRQSMKEWATTRSSRQVMSPRRAFLGRQRGKRQPILLTRKCRVVFERKVRQRRQMRERMKMMREKRMMGMTVMLTRGPSKLKVQEVLGMGMPVCLSFLKCGLLTISCRQ